MNTSRTSKEKIGNDKTKEKTLIFTIINQVILYTHPK